MKRSLLGWCSCVLALAIGLLTAGVAAANRARGDEFDRLERWCEAQSRRNELARVANQRREWRLLSGRCGNEQEPPRAGSEAAP